MAQGISIYHDFLWECQVVIVQKERSKVKRKLIEFLIEQSSHSHHPLPDITHFMFSGLRPLCRRSTRFAFQATACTITNARRAHSFHPLINGLVSALQREQPCLAVSPRKIQILSQPSSFYETLLVSSLPNLHGVLTREPCSGYDSTR